MISWLKMVISWLSSFRSERRELLLEVFALRQQILVLQRARPRPRVTRGDRLFWVVLSKIWSGWKGSLLAFKPQTVVGWQRSFFRVFWRWKSRCKGGRPKRDEETVKLLRQMWRENPTWGAPKIKRELLKLGITVAISTIQKYKPKGGTSDGQRWKTFLHNHMKSVVSVDFFTVPTVTFRVLYVFVVLHHERRRILHFNITESPTAAWTGQQMVNAFAFESAPKYLLRDRDGIYGNEFTRRVTSLGMDEVKSAPRCPWQNPYVERMIGTIRRECLDHMIIFHEGQLHKILKEFFDYYHRIRPHKSLADDAPDGREVEDDMEKKIVAFPVLGGLHHHYTRQAA